MSKITEAINEELGADALAHWDAVSAQLMNRGKSLVIEHSLDREGLAFLSIHAMKPEAIGAWDGRRWYVRAPSEDAATFTTRMTTKTVVIQNWDERERGWGARPDGFTVHVDRTQRDAYLKYYNETYNNLPSAPDEYTCASGEPIEATCSYELFDRIEAAIQESPTKMCVWGQGNFFKATREVDRDGSPLLSVDLKIKHVFKD